MSSSLFDYALTWNERTMSISRRGSGGFTAITSKLSIDNYNRNLEMVSSTVEKGRGYVISITECIRLSGEIAIQLYPLWVTATSYSVNTIVRQSGKVYKCLITHTSGVFATDLAANKWVEITTTYAPQRGDMLEDAALNSSFVINEVIEMIWMGDCVGYRLRTN